MTEIEREEPRLDPEFEEFEASGSESEELGPKPPQAPTKKAKATKKQSKSGLAKKKVARNEEMVARKTQIALFSPQLMADYIAGTLRRKHKDLSSLELADLGLNQSFFVDSASFQSDRTTENYHSYFNEYLEPHLKPQQGEEAVVLVLAMSAIRACDITRSLRQLKGGAIKLIKKNKVDHDKIALQNRKGPVVVSTAGRVSRLAKDGVLNLDQIKAIVVDTTYLDPKAHSIWDHEDTVPVLRQIATKQQAPKIYLY